jgi:hypothetical protein
MKMKAKVLAVILLMAFAATAKGDYTGTTFTDMVVVAIFTHLDPGGHSVSDVVFVKNVAWPDGTVTPMKVTATGLPLVGIKRNYTFNIDFAWTGELPRPHPSGLPARPEPVTP